jgi:2-polyprenyl-6-hydroxyphenyl methylase / 3-demethylubiquinone-9 3-methyltransferase
VVFYTLFLNLRQGIENKMNTNTQNAEELEHFKNLSSTWWDETGPFRVLHAITPLRMAFIKENVSIAFRRSDENPKPFKGLRILDVGCGGGLLCEPLTRLGADVTGIDPVEENLIVGKDHARKMGLVISYLPYAIEDLPKELPLFDVVIASEIIEHVDNPDGFLKECAARLKPTGGMIVTTFNKTLKSYLLGILAAEYVLGWAPKGTHSWNKFMSPEELSYKLKGLGFSDQELTGLCFSPLSCEWQLSSSTDVNYFLWAFKSS